MVQASSRVGSLATTLNRWTETVATFATVVPKRERPGRSECFMDAVLVAVDIRDLFQFGHERRHLAQMNGKVVSADSMTNHRSRSISYCSTIPILWCRVGDRNQASHSIRTYAYSPRGASTIGNTAGVNTCDGISTGT